MGNITPHQQRNKKIKLTSPQVVPVELPIIETTLEVIVDVPIIEPELPIETPMVKSTFKKKKSFED